MALLLDKDINTGIELDNMYFRIDKINFNDHDFQVVATGYASEKAYQEGKLPISEPRAYTLKNYNRDELVKQNVFEFAYNCLKTAKAFEDAKDVFEPGQEQNEPLPIEKIQIPLKTDEDYLGAEY